MEGHVFVWFDEKYSDGELGTLVDLHTRRRRVHDVRSIVPLLVSYARGQVEVL